MYVCAKSHNKWWRLPFNSIWCKKQRLCRAAFTPSVRELWGIYCRNNKLFSTPPPPLRPPPPSKHWTLALGRQANIKKEAQSFWCRLIWVLSSLSPRLRQRQWFHPFPLSLSFYYPYCRLMDPNHTTTFYCSMLWGCDEIIGYMISKAVYAPHTLRAVV